MILFLCFSACASIGFLALKSHPFYRRLSLKPRESIFPKAAIVLTLVVLFPDLTHGFEPSVTEQFRPTSCHEFVKLQKGEFRIVDANDVGWSTINFAAYTIGICLEYHPCG